MRRLKCNGQLICKVLRKISLFTLFTASSIGGISIASAATTIIVDTTLDYAEVDDDIGRVDNYTCSFSAGQSGALFSPAPNNKCTLRRAILEAGVRPDGDRPITIEFNIPTNDPNYNAALGIWEVQIDSSFIWEIKRRFISDDGGQVTVDGGTRPGGGPAIMINTNSENSPIFGSSLEVRTANNTFRNLGFHGGGQIILYEDHNLVESVWMGLTNNGLQMKLASTASSQAMRSMARGGIIMPNSASDNNIIRTNRIIGANERAIRVTSTGSNNLIEDNFIGMNANGDVPITSTINCSRSSDYDSSLWYGGRGIQVTGSHNIIQNNRIAGLHVTQATNETPPISMEIFGIDNVVTGNTVGIDASNKKVGTCGQGLLLGGSESIATANHFYFTRNGFDPGDIGDELDAVIITQSFLEQGSRWIRVWNNIIEGGNNTEANFHAYRFSEGVNEDLRKFIPAKITSIKGTTISGTNGDRLLPTTVNPFCPNCTVYLYLDDTDDRIESFALLGTALADSNGDWTTTISRPLSAGEGIRTQSMVNDNQTILADPVPPFKYYAALTTTRLSDVLYTSSNAGIIPILMLLLLEG
ncbi:MAG: hypothetical protein V3U71_03415 [Cocleimonas sp.]